MCKVLISGLSLRARCWEFSPLTIYVHTPGLLSSKKWRKQEPKEIPSCLILHLIIVFTLWLEIIVTSLLFIYLFIYFPAFIIRSQEPMGEGNKESHVVTIWSSERCVLRLSHKYVKPEFFRFSFNHLRLFFSTARIIFTVISLSTVQKYESFHIHNQI